MADKCYRVKCRGYDNSGRGLVKFNGSTLPVAGVIDGEMVHMRLKHTNHGTIGLLDHVEIASPNRVEPMCPKAGLCGACQLMHMTYAEQLRFKQSYVENLFGKYCKVQPVKGMDEPLHYRNKVHATFSYDKKGHILAGIYEENSHRVVNIKDCLIQDTRANEIVEAIKKIMDKQKIAPYNEDKRRGIVRHVLIRTAMYTGQVMVVPVIGQESFPGKKNFVNALLKACPQITTVILNYNTKKTSMVLGEREEIVFGAGYIEDELCGLRFKLSPKSFYQVNTAQTEVLYQTAFDMADMKSDERVLDAYCGIGTISLATAENVKEVVGVEINKQAIINARENAKLNHAKNVSFICADAGKYMVEAARKKESFDTVIVDPPRSGCDRAFLSALVKISPKKVVYISCNPQTQKENAEYLMKHGYKIEGVQPVDMFGFSNHVETVCCLHRVNS